MTMDTEQELIPQETPQTAPPSRPMMGLELALPGSTRRLRCSLLICVSWSLVVVCGLVLLIIILLTSAKQGRLDIGIKEPWYVRRADWLAQSDNEIDLLELPVGYVLIGHTALDTCLDKYSCIRDVHKLQATHKSRGWNDIGPNFLVGGNGDVFEGRGANVVGVMVTSWNLRCISIMFMGDYSQCLPLPVQFEHVDALLEELVRLRVLKPDYVMYGHCQVQKGLITPGPKLMYYLDKFKHWSPANKSSCVHV